MGSPTIYYYPDKSGTLETIDLVDVSDIEVSIERFRSDSERVTGGLVVTDYGMRHVVRVVRARFEGTTQAGEDLRDELQTLEGHLQRGGFCGFAFDADKAWAGFLKQRKKRGDTALLTHGNVFYNTSAALATDDRVTIQSANPEGIVERARLVSVSGDSVTLQAGLKNKLENLPVLVRHRDFYPVMRMSSRSVNTPIITTDRRANYTLDLQLVEDVDSLFKFAGYGGTLTGTTDTAGARAKSIDQVIGQFREFIQGSKIGGGTKLNRG